MREGMGRKLARLSTPLFLVVFVVIVIWAVTGVRRASEASASEGLRIAEQAVRRAAASCYALEGAYPDSWESLKAHTGIAVDEDTYRVFYEIFASNIMPDITVTEKRGEWG